MTFRGSLIVGIPRDPCCTCTFFHLVLNLIPLFPLAYVVSLDQLCSVTIMTLLECSKARLEVFILCFFILLFYETMMTERLG